MINDIALYLILCLLLQYHVELGFYVIFFLASLNQSSILPQNSIAYLIMHF